MTNHTQQLKRLLDRDQIRDCLARLARGEDRRNSELITGAYWPAAVIDYGIFSGTLEQYLAWVVPGSPDIPVTQHFLGQSLIDLHADTAFAETHMFAYHRIAGPDHHRDVVIGGRYLDWMESVSGEWRIAQRTIVYDWWQDFGESADWAMGLMGMPFGHAHYTGRAIADPSEDFLGDCWTRKALSRND
ncbi:hypothetical protein MRAB57_1751 [Mycobacterium rhizamassiliense]|jgi:hypothetical protein|uniref:SnoaL-like domain-containing protein n=1 Tax=Mycobacterium rhizamassiliense TaxID=1841860 RepID=A0A2U3NR32_9MYCO|nr:nuclear transport factor 2 family protein [Mycobacterium rhizamassiliense]SPM33944.1 hypothetical protein MRAB57_1751 [Mycobacterium rhizamassiliense]